MKKVIFIPFAIFLVVSCVSRKGVMTIHNLETPAGTLKISDNFFVDRTEITNFSWLEYMFYTGQVYGKKSPEYHACLPDTTVWNGLDKAFTSYYLRHPAYRYFPVVGISRDQACAYSRWRSDRVMEFILVREGIIQFRTAHTPDSMFTIEKYFSGQYLGYQPLEKFRYYPEYSLPTKAQWQKINLVADSLNVRWAKKYGHKIKEEKYREFYHWKRDTLDNNANYTVEVKMSRYDKRPVLWHVKGNVRELGAEKKVSYGGSWKDSIKTILETEQFPAREPNAWTGFRNVCVWKKWE